MDDTLASDEDLAGALRSILADMDATPDSSIGGSAVAARTNARRAAAYFLAVLEAGATPPPTCWASIPWEGRGRHHGPGGTASSTGRTSPPIPGAAGCLAAFETWAPTAATNALTEATRAAEAKMPADKRVSNLERENLLLRAENERLRRELAILRGLVARTGRLP